MKAETHAPAELDEEGEGKEEEEEEEGGGGQEEDDEQQQQQHGHDYQPENDAEDKREADRDDDSDNYRFQHLFRKFLQDDVEVRVHDVKIIGNIRTLDSVIEAQFEDVKKAKTTKELLRTVDAANSHLESLGMFDKCTITLEPGPVELPGTANVVVAIEESKSLSSFDVAVMTKPETNSAHLEASVRWKNLLGHAETWDSTGSYCWRGISEMSAGLHFPHFKSLPAALVVRASVFTQDWTKYAAFKEHLMGLSVGLVTDDRHDISYNLTWRNLQDPDHLSSRSIRRQLGHALLSSIKYTFKLDKRDSSLRPTSGYAFRSATQLAGIGPNNKLLRFIRQELDLRCAIPLGFYNSALNLGLSGGVVFPWGQGSRQQETSISDRFFLGGHSSLVCDMNGPATLLGFRTRGVGPTDVRRVVPSPETATEDLPQPRDTLGGDLAMTAFADLSFDLPWSFLKEQNIHGHCFACSGNLAGLSEVDRQSLSWKKLWSSFRCSAGVGLVIPTRLFRLEVNYCEVLRQFSSDRGKRGFQISVSTGG